MVRTVKVRLELDRDDFKRELGGAAGDVRTFDGEVQAAGKDVGLMGIEVKATGKEVAATGKEVETASQTTRTLGDEAAKAKTKVTGLGSETDKLGRTVKETAQETVKAKESVTGLGSETVKTSSRMQELARDIELTKTAVKNLAAAWVATRADDIGPMLRDQQEHLRNLRAEYDKLTSGGGSNNKSLFSRLFDFTGINPSAILSRFSSLGIQAGDLFGNGFMGVLKGVFSATWPVLVPIIAAAATAAGAGLSGALLGGLGLSGLGAAIASHINDPAVHAAISALGSFLKASLYAATSPLTNEIAPALAAFQREAAPFFATMRAGFASLAPYLSLLTMRLGEALTALGPGLSRALAAAGPIIGELANRLPTLLTGVNVFFDEISKGGKGAAEAIDVMIRSWSLWMAGLGFTLRALSDIFDFLVQGMLKISEVLASIPGAKLIWGPIRDQLKGIANSFDEATIAAGPAKEGIGGVASAENDVAAAAQRANQATQDLLGQWMSVDQANIAVEQSFLALRDSVAQNGRSMAENTSQGLANRSMLLGVVQAAEQKRERDIALAQGTDHVASSTAAANQKYEETIGRLYAAAKAAGLNSEQVDQLIGVYKRVPGGVSTRVTAEGVDTAIEKVISLQTHLNALHDRTFTITTLQNTVTGETRQVYHSGPDKFGRWGDVFEHAAVGKLRDADVFSAVSSGARYGFAEPETGGEAFIPKKGDQARSRAIWGYVGQNWLGMRQAPAGPGSAVALALNITVKDDTGRMFQVIRREVANQGGNVQIVLGSNNG